jgi:predicted ATPase
VTARMIRARIAAMAFRLRIKNFRALRHVDWSPAGVCALVGPNASGKTTLLDVPAMLGDALGRGLARAFEEHGGLDALRTFAAPDEDPIEFEVSLGELSWRMIPSQTASGFQPWERVFRAGEVLATRERSSTTVTIHGKTMQADDQLAAGVLFDVEPTLKPLGDLLTRYRLYSGYDIRELRRRGSDESTERRLNRRGANVFSVLRNWRDRRADKHRFDFVLDGLREIFPSFFDDLEFSKAAQIVGAELRIRPYDKLISTGLAPDGWFVALLHLTAVASADPGDVIALDEPENALHPHALKVLIELIRDWSKQHRVTVLLATHSPVLLDAFRDCPEQLYVMEPGRDVLPVALSTLREQSWLSHFALGDLYAHDEFGAPSEP